MVDPIPAGLLASSGMGLMSSLLGGRAADREGRRASRREALANLQQSLGSANQRGVTGMGQRQPGVMEGILGDPVTQELVQQLIAGQDGTGSQLYNWLASKLGGGGVSAAAKAAGGGMGRQPALRGTVGGAGMGMGRQMNPNIKPRLGGY